MQAAAFYIFTEETAMEKVKRGEIYFADLSPVARLCEVLNCQPGDLMEYVPETDISEKARV